MFLILAFYWLKPDGNPLPFCIRHMLNYTQMRMKI